MGEVTERMLQIAVASLPGYGFEFDHQSSLCNELQTRLQRFMALLCAPYEVAIDRHLAEGNSDRTAIELNTWTISELTELWHTALGRFRDRIASHERITVGQQRIGCDMCAHYLTWLVDETEVAKNERARARDNPPRASKAQRKRAKHKWTPYGIDVVAEIARDKGELTERMLQIALSSLPAYGFDLEPRSNACNDLETKLRPLMKLLCEPYEEEINRRLATGGSDHRRNELVSWAISELSGTWHTALERFRNRIAHTEKIGSGQQRIGCDTSSRYFTWLIDEIEVAKAERAKNQRPPT